MDLDVRDAEQVEEMAEIAGAFLEDLGAERVLVVHGDEEHAAPVTQVFSGLTYEGIESLLFEWGSTVERSESAFRAERYGRHILVAPLRDSSGDCLGMLYADNRKGFADDAVDGLHKFAQHYLNLLLEICVLRAGVMVVMPIDIEETPQESAPPKAAPAEQTAAPPVAQPAPLVPAGGPKKALTEWRFEEVIEDEDESAQDPPPGEAFPDLQEYVILDWYR